MNILVFGAGAIGTYIGGSLSLSGDQVVFLERPEVAAGLHGRGLRLGLEDGEHTIPEPRLTGSLEEALSIGSYEVAIFAIKSNDTPATLAHLEPLARQERLPPFLCLQNGVENEPALERVLGPGQVIAGTVTSAIGRRGPGDILVERKRGIGIAAGPPLSGMLASRLSRAGLNARLYPQAADMKWSKLLTNLLGNATSAILGMTPAEVFSHPGLYQIEIGQLREALRVMSALGLRPVNLPRTPVRLLALAARALPTALSRPLVAQAAGGGRGGKMPSFYIDLHSGKGSSEVDYLNGAVVRFGKRLGIPTPINCFLTDTLLALTRKELPLEEYAGKPDKFIQGIRDRG